MLWAVIVSTIISCCYGVIERPRGVPPSRALSYQPNAEETFTCLTTSDGSVVSIPFIYVNDDYCDCEDGSDEPGTAACPNSKFFCENRGYKGEFILSSRVNDGICDCCDGSDEYSGEKIQCGNLCIELGRQQREELVARQKLREAGYKIKQEYMQKGKIARDEKQSRLKQIEQEQEEWMAQRTELEERHRDLVNTGNSSQRSGWFNWFRSFEWFGRASLATSRDPVGNASVASAKKKEVEEPERIAKETHEAAWNEQKAEKEKEKERTHALQVFDELDVNDDGHVDLHEMLTHEEFDVDSDGSVSHDEAKEYLEDLERAGKDEFLEKIWPNIKEIYKSSKMETEDKGDTEEASSPPATEPTIQPPADVGDRPTPLDPSPITPPIDIDDIEEGRSEEEEEEDDDDDADDDDFPPAEEKKEEEKEEEVMPEYNEETKTLIEVANEARRKYDEIADKVKDSENEIIGLKKYLETDFGPEQEFAVMDNQCFEFNDREYTYKLCPFNKASQRPKAGGSETSLGLWGHWEGSGDNKYSAQKYEKGQNCWNGPDRSVKVLLQCGSENALLSASEPSRCEYQFEFATPAVCKPPSLDEDKSEFHDEL